MTIRIIHKPKLRTDFISGFSGHSPPGSIHGSAAQPSLTEQELVFSHQPHWYSAFENPTQLPQSAAAFLH